MAAQFDQARTTFQATPGASPIPIDTFDQQASFLTGLAGQQRAFQGQLLGQASSAFDKALSSYNEIAVQNAQDDAAGIIKRDGSSQLIAPTSFWPEGLHSKAYADAYKTSAEAIYQTSAVADYSNYSATMQAKFPTDVVSYNAGMEAKRQSMMANIDPQHGPIIDLRLQQVAAQGATQIGVTAQAEQNTVMLANAELERAKLTDDAARTAVSGVAVAAGQGGAGYDNNVGNITQSNANYAGGKLQPYAHPNGLAFERFSSPEHGTAAAYSLIKAKVDGAGGNMSFDQLVGAWDPNASPETKKNYAGALAKAAGLEPGDKVPIADTDKMAGVVRAMNIFEKGKQTVPDSAFKDGVRLAQGDSTVQPNLNATAVDAVAADAAKAANTGDARAQAGIIAERWKGLEAMYTRAGKTPDFIARQKVEFEFNVSMATQAEILKKTPIVHGQDGSVDQAQVAALQDRVTKIAEQYPGRKAQVQQVLGEAINYATTQGQRMAQSQQLADSKKGEQIARDTAAQAQAARLSKDPVTQAAAKEALDRRGLAILNDSTLSDSTAMRAAGAAVSAGAVAKAALEESNTNRLVSLNGIIANPDPTVATPAAKERARAELLTISTDPEITKDLTPGQRQYAQTGIDAMVRSDLQGDFAKVRLAAPEGKMEPAAFDAMLADGVKQGRYGDHPGSTASLAELAQVSAVNRDAYNKRLTTQEHARAGLASAAAGVPLTDTQKDAVKAALPYKLPGSAEKPDWSNPGAPADLPNVTPDITNPEHRQSLVDYVRKTGIVPDVWKQTFDAMPKTPDANAMAPYLETYGQLYQVAFQKAAQRTGKMPTDNEIKAELTADLGVDTALYLSNARKNGAEAAYRLNTKDGPKVSVTGATGQPTEAQNTTTDKSIDNFLADNVKAGQSSSWLSKMSQGRIPGTESWEPTADERAQAALAKGSPDVAPGLFERATGTTVFGSPAAPTAMTMTAEARAYISDKSNALMATHGNEIAAQAGDMRPQDFATKMTMEDNANLLEVVRNKDGSATIGLKSFAKATGDAMGTPKLAPETSQAVLSQLVYGDRRINNTMGADFDPKTISAVPYLNDSNQPRWFVTARENKTGMPVQLLDISQQDPRLSAETLALDRSAMLTMQRNLVGTDGKPVSAGTAAAYGAAFARYIQTPFQEILKGHYVAGAAMDPETHKAFTDEFDRRLNEIRDNAGLPAVDWKTSMKNIAHDSVPDDGRNGMIRSIAREHEKQQALELEGSGKPQAPQSSPLPPLGPGQPEPVPPPRRFPRARDQQ